MTTVCVPENYSSDRFEVGPLEDSKAAHSGPLAAEVHEVAETLTP